MAFPVIMALPLALLLQTPAVPPKVDPPGTYQANTPDLVDPVLKKQVDADFPKAAKQANVRAIVTVHAVIGPDGKVSKAWVTSSQVYADPAQGSTGRLDSMSGTLGLDDAAVQAAVQWMFEAGKLRGRPVPVAWAIVFEFKDGAPAVGQLSPPLAPPPNADFAKGVRDAMAPGVVAPRILERVDPKYPSLALQQKIQGEVWIRAVVLEDGSVGDVQVTKSLDREHGMDDAAVTAAKKWKFSPATENGAPIPVVVTITMEFRARSH